MIARNISSVMFLVWRRMERELEWEAIMGAAVISIRSQNAASEQ